MKTINSRYSQLAGFLSENEILLRNLILLSFTLFVISFSVWQGAYNSDAHHWGLMLSNAKDFIEGRAPYKEIFIQYGILTTLIHAGAASIFGENLRSLIIVTAVAYSAGLLLLYFLSLKLSGNRRLAIYAFISATLLHPLAIYPWSNYIAFPFLIGGTLTALSMEDNRAKALAAGLLLGLSILCREGLFPAVLLFACAFTLIRLTKSNRFSETAFGSTLVFWIGLALPLSIFFAYLWQSHLYEYWYKTAILLPRLYAEIFLKDGFFHGLMQLATYLLSGIFGKNSRIFFLLLITCSAGITIIAFLLRRPSFKERGDLLLVAIFSALLLSASLHLNEIFRLATSITIGTILVYLFAAKYRIENWVFGIFCTLFVFSLAGKNNGNYFFPTRTQISEATESQEQPLFTGQKWPARTFDFYLEFERDMKLLKNDRCGIKYYANGSSDVFLSTLTPFTQYQLAPFGQGRYDVADWTALRPEFDKEKRSAEQQDIVLFSESSQRRISSPPSWLRNCQALYFACYYL